MIYNQLAALPELTQAARLRQEQSAGNGQDLAKVARQFESIFTHMMIKSMRQASLGNELFSSNDTQTYRDMFDQQIAQAMSQGKGLGIAEAMLRQLQPQQPKPESEDAQAAIPLTQSHKQAAAPEFTRITVQGSSVAEAMQKPLITEEPRQFMPSQSVSSYGAASTAATISSREVLRLDVAQQHARDDSPEGFIARVWPAAKRVANELGVSPRVLVAQAALETGWGRHMPKHADGSSSENYFGIKGHGQWQGEHVTASTSEVINGERVQERAQFRAYDSIEASFQDFAKFLKTNPRYEQALNHRHDAEKFVDSLQKAGYATDPMYADKLKSIMNGRRMNMMVAQIDAGSPEEPTSRVV